MDVYTSNQNETLEMSKAYNKEKGFQNCFTHSIVNTTETEEDRE